VIDALDANGNPSSPTPRTDHDAGARTPATNIFTIDDIFR
jgi:hypothetical protein